MKRTMQRTPAQMLTTTLSATISLILASGLAIAQDAPVASQTGVQADGEPGLSLRLETGPPPPILPPQKINPRIQLAILLDTSGSMDGLIEQAKAQLWTIVNELALASRDGRPPELEVALYEYGKSSVSSEVGHIRQILPLTRDLDAVAAELFALRTNGGEEYCGWVVADATRDLAWADDATVLKMIVIAGNEPFTQGPVDFHTSLPAAIAKGVVVNTIFCGSESQGMNSGWAEAARLADGAYAFIDQNSAVPQIETPMDAELARLSAELNTTYLAFGSGATEGLMRQEMADVNALTAAPAQAADRAAAKASSLYSNARWDLVDASREADFDLGEVDAEDLPEPMRAMSSDERKAYVVEHSERRIAIQREIGDLQKQRRAFIDQAQRDNAEQGPTLGTVMVRSLRAQAESLGFVFDDDTTHHDNDDSDEAPGDG